jgi:hypothetical protein
MIVIKGNTKSSELYLSEYEHHLELETRMLNQPGHANFNVEGAKELRRHLDKFIERHDLISTFGKK